MDRPIDVKTLEKMPDEVIIQILQELDASSLAKVCTTSKKFSKLCKDKDIWKKLYKRDIMDKKPCLDWDWRDLYFAATQIYVTVYNVNILNRGVFDTFLIIGEGNIIPQIEKRLRTVYNYTDDDFEIIEFDLLEQGIGSDLRALVEDYEGSEADFWKLPNGEQIKIEDLGTAYLEDVFRLIPILKKRELKGGEI